MIKNIIYLVEHTYKLLNINVQVELLNCATIGMANHRRCDGSMSSGRRTRKYASYVYSSYDDTAGRTQTQDHQDRQKSRLSAYATG